MSAWLYADVRMPLCNPFGYDVDLSGTMKTISGGGDCLPLIVSVVWAVAVVVATAKRNNSRENNILHIELPWCLFQLHESFRRLDTYLLSMPCILYDSFEGHQG